MMVIRILILLLLVGVMAVAYHHAYFSKEPKNRRRRSHDNPDTDSLPHIAARRIRMARRLLNKHPDLTNSLGMPASKRYHQQIETLIHRYQAVGDGDEAFRLLDQGLDAIEDKLVAALTRKTDARKEDLEIYIAFLNAAD